MAEKPAMPPHGDPRAPYFDPDNPRTLRRFFQDLEALFERSGVESDAQKKQWVLRYFSIDVADLCENLPEYHMPSFLRLLIASSGLVYKEDILCPALQSRSQTEDGFKDVAGSLVAIAKAVQQTSFNADDIRALQAYIEQLNRVISPEALPPTEQWPAPFRKRLADFESDLKKIEHEVKVLVSAKAHDRFLSAQERAGDIGSLMRSLGSLVNLFTRVEENVREIRQHSDQRFDGMRMHIDEGVTRVVDAIENQHCQKTSTIPGLHPTLSALYNDSESGRSECEPDTRKEALATIYAWILGPDHPELSQYPKPVLDVSHDRLIMWLYALAGVGKSTLSMSTARWCYIRRILAATFFCGRDGDRSNVLAIMPTIAFQLAHRCPIFREALRKAVAENPNVHQMSVASQLENLIVEPLCAAIKGGSHAFDDAVIIVDALDECTDDEAVSVVVKSLAIHHERLGPLRFLITSRPEPNIRDGFVIPALAANTQEFPLNEIPDELTSRDIKHFLQARLQAVGRSYSLLDWPSEDQSARLVNLTELLFIFAATAVLYVGDRRARNRRLQLDACWKPVELRRLRVRRAVRVRVVQERLDRGQDRRDVVRR
ncbi:hypothetical protein NUW54_g9939 [Trametes sanguinea]|uniref:Uncharacterized protein n=1 Tax=Trametes sanguinea TaxID=158606 RepID=A0ACC1P540_9APHY|nr:hypothetical protein NUW54_g9939 [Trametes sanguinea]